MHKKNNLFDLIKGLTAPEKRYFKCSFSSNGGDDPIFLKLFNAIDKMEEYDESMIKRKFKGEKFVRQLHVTKIYLQDSILKSLRSFHTANSHAFIVKDLLKNIDICFSKELYQQCNAEIQKAEKIAIRIEDDLSLFEIQNWKRKLAQAQSPQNANIKEIILALRTPLQRLNNTHKLWELMVGLADQAPPDKEHAQSLNEKLLLYHLLYRNDILHQRNEEAKKHLLELIEILEDYPARIHEEPGLYLSSVNNLVSFLVFTKDYEKAFLLISKARAFYENASRKRRTKNNFRQMLRLYNSELEIYRDTENLDKGISLIREIERQVQRHSDSAPLEYLVSLWFQFAYIYFLNRDFKLSLRWINEVMNSSFASLRPDLHIQIHFLNLMVHFELKNFFVMRHFAAGTIRFAKKNQSFKSHHKKLLDFFAKLGSVPEAEYRGLFEKLYTEIVVKKLIPASDLDYINWNKWITSKVKRESL